MTKRVLSQCFPTVNAVIEKDGKFLLVQEGIEKGKDANTWNLPGGWIDIENDDPIKAIIREVREETGLKFLPQNVIGIFSLERQDLKENKNSIPHPIRIIISGQSSGKVNPEMKDEISDARWFSLDELKNIDLRDKDIPEVINCYLNDEKYPLNIIHHKVQK